ncbi:MAG: YbjN domain-containing protein [Dermatophilaceae bacterium]
MTVGAAARRLAAVVTDYLDSGELAWEHGSRGGEFVVSLPGEKKLKTVVSLVCSDRALSVSAFVIRNPDENHDEVYRYLLRRNLRLPGLAYAVDRTGDVYVTGRLPAAAVDAEQLDQLLGVVLSAADEPFDELLLLGFATSMRKEWAWRVSRGESLRNLETFRGVLARPGDPPPEPR